LNSSEQNLNLPLDKSIEEAWLLWKLNKKQEAKEVVEQLLPYNPQNRDLLYLASIIYFDEDDLNKVQEFLDRLKNISGKTKDTQSLRASLYVKQERWQEAEAVFSEMIEDFPEERDLQRDYAYVLSRLRKWEQSKLLYESLMEDPQKKDEIVWEYREVVEEGSNRVRMGFQYNHAPESLRQKITTQSYTQWIRPSVRIQGDIFEELYTKRVLGATSSTREWVIGSRLTADWFPSDRLKISGSWEAVQNSSEDSHQIGLAADYRYENMHAALSYQYNHFIRSPLESFEKKGRLDRLELINDIVLFKRLTVGHVLQNEWYRVDKAQNIVNDKESLGSKLINDGFIDIRLLEKPYISFYMHYKRSVWDKSFTRANEVLDFIEAERLYYGGISSQWKIGSRAGFSSSVTRLFDEKRNYYTTLSQADLNVWVKENLKTRVSYEYGYNIDGTSGSGNSQQMNFLMEYFF